MFIFQSIGHISVQQYWLNVEIVVVEFDTGNWLKCRDVLLLLILIHKYEKNTAGKSAWAVVVEIDWSSTFADMENASSNCAMSLHLWNAEVSFFTVFTHCLFFFILLLLSITRQGTDEAIGVTHLGKGHPMYQNG